MNNYCLYQSLIYKDLYKPYECVFIEWGVVNLTSCSAVNLLILLEKGGGGG